MVAGDAFADGAAEAADEVVLFGGDDAAGVGGAFQDQFFVEGFDGVDVNYSRGDVFCGEEVARGESLFDHQTGSDDGYVFAVGEDSAFAPFEFVGVLVEEDRDGEASEAHIAGTDVVYRGFYHRAGFDGVGGLHYYHSGDRAHCGEVFEALVGGAVLTDRDSGVGGADFDVQMRISDGVPDLLEGASCGEHCEGAAKWDETCGGETCGDCYHVALGYSAVEEAVGEFFLEFYGFCGFGEVGVEDYQFVVFVAEFGKGGAVGFTCSDFFCHD